FLVTMPYGSGRVVYVSAGEMWRLRQCRGIFYERFWAKLARYAGSGTLSRLGKRGGVVLGQAVTAGQFVPLHAQRLRRDLKELSPRAVPKVRFSQVPPGATMPAVVELKPKPGSERDWQGWFQARFRVLVAGEYRLEVQVPETGDLLPRRFMVKESNP